VSRLNEETKIIPRTAWVIATILCIAVPAIFWIFWGVMMSSAEESRIPPIPFLIGGLFAAVAMFVYILVLGYIAADAKRRGMRVVLWVLLAIFIPNAIGIILYFILRDPLLRHCPSCGASAGPSYAFCPSCGGSLGAACPSCRGPVEPGWSHCARCGASLGTA